MKKRDIYITLMLLICIAIPMITLAQGPPDPDDSVPIDGGLSLLVAAGVAYGAKRYRNRKKTTDEPDMK
jgi:hypothetical protein